MQKIKVLHSYPIWLPATHTWMYNLVRNLSIQGCEPHVVCEHVQNLDTFHVPNIHCLCEASRQRQVLDKGLKRLGVRHYLGFMVKLGRQLDAPIVHSHFGRYGWTDLGAVRRLRARHVVTYYGYDVTKLPAENPIWLSRYRELFRRADLFLCEGGHMRERLVALGCPEEKVAVQHIGVDMETIRYRPRQWVPGKPLKILIAASFREKKGIPDALHAISRVSDAINIVVTLVGDAGGDVASQREKQRILATIKDLNLGDRVRLTGYQSSQDLMKTAGDSHVFLSPSITASDGDTEGGAPVTLTEMMASGIPVVSTRHCDIPEVVDYGVSDWLVSESDIDGLADRILYLANHPDSWKGMLDEGNRHVRRHYDLAVTVAEVAQKYRSLL